MEEELGRNAQNENNLTPAQRLRDTSRLLVADLEAEGRLPTITAPKSLREKSFDAQCREAEKPVLSLDQLPPLASLIYPRQTRLGAMLERIPKPDGYIPRMHFPAWSEWPLYRKLPNIPVDSFVFSRGQLNQPLQRITPRREYTTVDPHNKFNFLPANDYNALHDPATLRYFNKPHVQKLLLKQGLITNEAEVICSQKEVNQYREYLEHFQINQLEKGLRLEEDRKQHQHMLEKEVRTYMAGNEDYRIRNELARERQKLLTEERVRSLKAKMREDAIRLKRFREERRKLLAEKRAEAKHCEEYSKKKRQELACEQENTDEKRKEILQKHARADLMAYANKMRKELIKSLKESNFMMAKSAFQTKELAKRKEIMDQLEADHEYRQQRYQERMETHRKEFPMMAEKRKANRQRILGIMRKFIDRWRAYVKRRKARRADPNHQSTWDVSDSTAQTVNSLHEISGHEKFDNFILNLIQLKREMATNKDQ